MTQQNNNSSKAASNQKQYYCYEIVGDNTAKTNSRGAGKDVFVKKIPVRGVTLTIGVFFDGTGNNVVNTAQRLMQFAECNAAQVGVSEEDAQACPEFMEKTVSNTSYNNYYTNIHWLSTLYKIDGQLPAEKTEAQIAAYISGVGTEDGIKDSKIGLAIASSMVADFKGIVTKTDEILPLISDAIAKFKELNKGQRFAIAKVQFDLFGFSRGAASARHFANRVLTQDKAIYSAINKGLGNAPHDGNPSGEVRFIGLFDTVTSIGSLLNFYDIHGPSNPGVDLDLPPNIARQVFHIIAQHECRYNFSLSSIKGVWPELPLPGAHADIGGGYNPKEEESLFLTLPKFEVVSEDTPEEETQVYRKTEEERKELDNIMNLKFLLPHGKVMTKTYAKYMPTHRQYLGLKKNVGAAVTLERTVRNDWSKVCLRVMLDAAQEAGVLFSSIDSKDPDLKLRPELQPFCDKAIAQGRAVRRGEEHFGFSSWELEVLGEFMHCSAHWNVVEENNIWIDPTTREIFILQYGPKKHLNPAIAYVNRPANGWHRGVWLMDEQQFPPEVPRPPSGKLYSPFNKERPCES